MSNVKRILSVILILALALMAFGGMGGCSGEKKPLRILLDIETVFPSTGSAADGMNTDAYAEEYVRNHLSDLLADVKEKGGFEDIEVEVLPQFDTDERKMRLTRLRTEIMAGEGPDVFIMRCADNPTPNNQAQSSLFLEPEKIMENGLLLPLDDYIKNARYMEWDKLTPQIMEAGRTEQWGQVLLPLVYQISATAYDGAAVEFTPSKEGTFAEAIQDPTGIQRNAVAWSVNGEDAGATLGALADYTASPRRLLFTEDELTRWLQVGTEIYQEFAQGAYDDLPENLGGTFCIGYEDILYPDGYRPDFLSDSEDSEGTTTFVPAYNRTGGATAVVDGYAAINGNTKRPKDAFLILDLLLSGEGQKKYTVSRDLIAEGMPVYEYEDGQYTGAALGQDNMKALQGVRAAVTQVNFRGTLSYELAMLHMKYRWIANGWAFGDVSFSESSVDEAVRTTYSRMQQEIAE